MRIPKLVIAMGYIEDDIISEAVKYKPIRYTHGLLHYVAIAACFLCISILVLPFTFGFIGNNATNIYHVGELIVISDMENIRGEYKGKLLTENLDYSVFKGKDIRLYYDEKGTMEDSNDWYSLIFYGKYCDYDMTIYCLFDQTKSLEDWKVDSVFKPETTTCIEINGIDVQLAGRTLPLDDNNQYYAIFEYQGVVYDVRVVSDDIDDMYTVLNDMLQDDLN